MLEKVRELLSDPNRWTKNTMARDKYNTAVSVYSPEATKFCLAGACHRVAGNYNAGEKLIEKIRARLYEMRGFGGIGYYNDVVVQDHGEILKLLDEVINAGEG
jgi:hypothetical protein